MSAEWVSISSFPGLSSHRLSESGERTLCGVGLAGRQQFPPRRDNPHCNPCAVASRTPRPSCLDLLSSVDELRILYTIHPSEEIREMIEEAEDSEASS